MSESETDGRPTVYYLGKPLLLEVAHAVWRRVSQDGDALRVTLHDTSDERRVKALVDGWLRAQADVYLPACLSEVAERCRKFLPNARCPLVLRSASCPDGLRLTVRAMKTRWGSCSAGGRITLSTELMHVPRRLIDYVIAHELCHLVRLDHSKAYYFQLARCLPDWRHRRQELLTRAWVRSRGGQP